MRVYSGVPKMKCRMKNIAAATALCVLIPLFSACAESRVPPPHGTPEVSPSAAVSGDSQSTQEAGEALKDVTDGMVIGKISEARMEWQGVSRLYSYYIPSTFNGKRMPIMLALHGSGGNAEIQMAAGNYAEIAEREGFIVVAPNAVVVLPIGDKRATYKNLSAEGLTMFDIADVYGDMALHYARPAASRTDPAVAAGIDDPGFYKALIDFYCDNGFADKNRAFASGHSHGGFMSLRLGYEYPEVFAGVASVAGLFLGELRELPPPKKQVKLVFINSSNDDVVPPSGMVYAPSLAPPDGVWGMPLDDGISVFMERYGLGALTETARTKLEPLSEFDTTRVTRMEYNGGAAVKYWFTGKDYETGGAGHAWPDSPSDPTNFSQYQATELFWTDLKIELSEELPSARIADGKLTVSVTRIYDNGVRDTVSADFPIAADVSECFPVDDCSVYVATSGAEVLAVRLAE